MRPNLFAHIGADSIGHGRGGGRAVA